MPTRRRRTRRAGNVLSNDTDVDGNPLTASLVTGPTNGAVVLAANGAFTYTPAANWFGTDTFTYAASDGLTASTALVTPSRSPRSTIHQSRRAAPPPRRRTRRWR